MKLRPHDGNLPGAITGTAFIVAVFSMTTWGFLLQADDGETLLIRVVFAVPVWLMGSLATVPIFWVRAEDEDTKVVA